MAFNRLQCSVLQSHTKVRVCSFDGCNTAFYSSQCLIITPGHILITRDSDIQVSYTNTHSYQYQHMYKYLRQYSIVEFTGLITAGGQWQTFWIPCLTTHAQQKWYTVWSVIEICWPSKIAWISFVPPMQYLIQYLTQYTVQNNMQNILTWFLLNKK